MTAASIRLIVSPADSPGAFRFQAAFPAPAADAVEQCAEAVLAFGDGQSAELGLLCAPTAITWREQRLADLGTYAYAGPGPYTAELRWGGASYLAAPAAVAEAAPAPPEVALFALTPVKDQPYRRRVALRVTGLTPGQQIRLDGGAGQIHLLAGAEDGEPRDLLLDYAKPGAYRATVELLDADGFWLAALAESPLEIVDPAAEAEPPALPAAAGEQMAAGEPWLPYRNMRPVRSTVTYTRPGGSVVQRHVGTATFLSVRAETVVGGQRWLQTAGGDWIAENQVVYFTPSALRGVELDGATPPPGARRGVVTADVLNVRARPGVAPDNPPIGTLRYGDEVTIYEERTVAGALWHRIGENRWVHSAYIRLLAADPPSPPPSPPPPPPPDVRRGVVTADVLNVRARPGVAPDNPPIATLRYGDEVTIYEERTVAGALWYRIGENRWVHSAYIRLLAADPPSPPPPPPPDTRRGVVTADVLNVRARPGVAPDNPPIATLRYGDEVTIYEERTVAGALWYRIGEGRWAAAAWIRVVGPAVRAATAAAPVTALPLGWVIANSLNVRARPGVSAGNPPLYQLGHYAVVPILAQQTVGGVRWFQIAAEEWVEGQSVRVARLRPRPASIGAHERWVGVNLSEQTLVAYEGDRPVFATLVASGLPGTPTVQGIFRTWRRLLTGKMVGPGYDIEDVTWTCYFYSGYALHTAYWHDLFGTPRSHGCVNLSPHDAWWIYQWSAPSGPNSPTVYSYWA